MKYIPSLVITLQFTLDEICLEDSRVNLITNAINLVDRYGCIGRTGVDILFSVFVMELEVDFDVLLG